MRFRHHICQLKSLVSKRGERRTPDYLALMRDIMFGLLALALVTGTIGYLASYFTAASSSSADPLVLLVNEPAPPHRTLPKGFPVTFPLPADSILEDVTAINTPESLGYRAYWTFPDQAPEALAKQFTAGFDREHWPYDAFDSGQGPLTIQFHFPGSRNASTLVISTNQNGDATAQLDLTLPPRR